MCPGHPVSPLPSSHDFSGRIGFFRELLVMATLSIVLLAEWVKGRWPWNKRAYLFIASRGRWKMQWRWHVRSFCQQRWQEKYILEMIAPGWVQVTAFVPRMCAALWCPHLRQAHVVLIHRIQTDSFTLSALLSLLKPSPASLHLSLQSRLGSHVC